MIESVKPVSGVTYAAGTKNVQDAVAEERQEADVSYIVDIESSRASENKSGNKLSSDQIAAIRRQVEASNASLRSLVEKLLSGQGSAYRTAFDNIEFDSDMTAAEAQQAISEDGYWGVNAVSDRIVAFAKAVSGDDPGKLTELKAAIDEGFKRAGDVFDGELPGICGETYNAIMDKLDDWAAESND